jgi:hypothetical protein
MREATTDPAVADAILRTLMYADVFHFPLTEQELHHFLIGNNAAPDQLHTALTGTLATQVVCADGYVALAGCEDDIPERQSHDRASAAQWGTALRYGAILAALPFVRMVAITGALAMRNARHDKDDIDYLIVTAPGHVWLTRLLAVTLVRIARLTGVELCPNYVLAESALVQDRRDLFIAHELAQMVPIAGMPVYRAMRAANGWTQMMLPNASGPLYVERDQMPRGALALLKRLAEALLSSPPGRWLEAWEYRRKLRKFSPQTQHTGSTAQLDTQRAKGHFVDHGAHILEQYRERLRLYHLPEEKLQLAGD